MLRACTGMHQMGLGAKTSELMPHHYPWSHIHLTVRNGFCPGEFDWGIELLSWVCCKLSSRWATESKLKDNIRRPCFLSYFKSCLKYYFCMILLLFLIFSLFTSRFLWIYIMFSVFYHITGFLSLGTSGSLFFGASFWALFILFPFLFFLSIFLFGLFCVILFFILSHYIFYLFYFIIIDKVLVIFSLITDRKILFFMGGDKGWNLDE